MDEFLPVNSQELDSYKKEIGRMSKTALLLETMRIRDSIDWVLAQQLHKTRTGRDTESVIAVWNAKLKIVSDAQAEKELFE